MFFLMHENVKVASFNVDAVEYIFDLQINPKAVVYLPYGLDTEVDLVQWLKNRGIPISRNHIKKELAQLGNITPFGLMLINRGLSLSDHYWFWMQIMMIILGKILIVIPTISGHP